MFRKRFSIKIHITTLFIALILAVGGVLAWFNYLKISDLLMSASDKMFRQIATEVTLDFKATYLPVASNVKLISDTQLPVLSTKSERLEKVPMMISLLKGSSQVAAIEVGYPDGDYFIVRAITSDYMKRQFDAPFGASYMADHINHQTSNSKIERIFFNIMGERIGSENTIPTDYDPRTRPWFTDATENTDLVATPPYLFYFIGKLGITLSYFDTDSGAVIAADITLEQLSHTISKHFVTPSSELVMTDNNHEIVAYKERDLVVESTLEGTPQRVHLSKLNNPVLEHFLQVDSDQNTSFSYLGQNWIGTTLPINLSRGNISLTVIAPENELLAEAVEIRNTSTILAAVILLLSLPITWFLAHRVARPLVKLTREAESINKLDFRQTSNTRSFVLEIDYLSKSINTMKSTINQFLNLIGSVTGEQDLDRLINTVTAETRKASTAQSVALYLIDETINTIHQSSFSSDNPNPAHSDRTGMHNLKSFPSFITSAIELKKTQQQTYQLANGSSLTHLDELLLDSELTEAELVAIPLVDRKKNVMGLLVLTFGLDEQDNASTIKSKISFAQILSGFCAESLEKNQLYLEQKELLESFIKLMAGAIDAKSPYTGGHCQRVPELAKLLTQATCESTKKEFKDFSMNDEKWEELHIASWLHDCGKVTTPEYVVDKATRLETIYNRIHEIRTRVEVIKRDLAINHQTQRADLALIGALDENQEIRLKSEYDQEIKALEDDFMFIAECNSGDKFMNEDNIKRLESISERTWYRTLSDQVGLSWVEKKRQKFNSDTLPVKEKLLSDKAEHLIERDCQTNIGEANPWGFKMDVPEKKFNLGEVYNLSIKAGTLTNEERFIINDHIIQTIIMLDKLPFPNHLKDVPEIAGNHHEKMDGTGYPRKLTSSEMSIPARIMAIADIFEALTASDRPYKEAKSLSESLKIMKFMAKDQHIDKNLFEVFLKSGTYLTYAQRFLDASQIDKVNIEDYLEAPESENVEKHES